MRDRENVHGESGPEVGFICCYAAVGSKYKENNDNSHPLLSTCRPHPQISGRLRGLLSPTRRPGEASAHPSQGQVPVSPRALLVSPTWPGPGRAANTGSHCLFSPAPISTRCGAGCSAARWLTAEPRRTLGRSWPCTRERVTQAHSTQTTPHNTHKDVETQGTCACPQRSAHPEAPGQLPLTVKYLQPSLPAPYPGPSRAPTCTLHPSRQEPPNFQRFLPDRIFPFNKSLSHSGPYPGCPWKPHIPPEDTATNPA